MKSKLIETVVLLVVVAMIGLTIFLGMNGVSPVSIKPLPERQDPTQESKEQPKFKVWKTVKHDGKSKTAREYLDKINESGQGVSVDAYRVLEKVNLSGSGEPVELDLVIATAQDLGFKEGATLYEICLKSAELGLELCPAWVIPELRLQYRDQPRGERLIVAMEPVSVSDRDSWLLAIERNYYWDITPAIDVCASNCGYFYPPFYKWLFVLPRAK